jgi:hypothetical protein
MRKKKVETKVIYIIFDHLNNVYARKYLSKVEDLTEISKSTLSKHFNAHNTPYEKGKYKVYKCENIDLKGYYKLNFR